MEAMKFTREDFQLMLSLARDTITAAARGASSSTPNLEDVPEHLAQEGACFVTLHKHGQLRGCIGVLRPRMPLIHEIVSSARSAAIEDPRFHPLTPEEVDQVDIEISILSQPEPLVFDDPSEIPDLLRPDVDGVILRKGYFRATFLPQVWEQLPDPVDFLEHLSLKMGLGKDTWRDRAIEVETYQVIEFSE